MIVSKLHRFIYIGIPKTGSISISHWLNMFYGGCSIGMHHDWRVPQDYLSYFRWTVVRNPYDRCFSLWWFECKNPNRRTKSPHFGMSFREHMLMNIRCRDHGDPLHDVPEARMTQTRYVEQSGAQRVFHLEFLDELQQLPFFNKIHPIPHHNQASSDRPRHFFECFGGDEEELVWEYCAEDFKNFGYKRNLR
jgi:hypothetical protein